MDMVQIASTRSTEVRTRATRNDRNIAFDGVVVCEMRRC